MPGCGMRTPVGAKPSRSYARTARLLPTTTSSSRRSRPAAGTSRRPVHQQGQQPGAPPGRGDVDGEDDRVRGSPGLAWPPTWPTSRPSGSATNWPGRRRWRPGRSVPVLGVRPGRRLRQRLQEGQRRVGEHLQPQRPHPGGVRDAHPMDGGGHAVFFTRYRAGRAPGFRRDHLRIDRSSQWSAGRQCPARFRDLAASRDAQPGHGPDGYGGRSVEVNIVRQIDVTAIATTARTDRLPVLRACASRVPRVASEFGRCTTAPFGAERTRGVCPMESSESRRPRPANAPAGGCGDAAPSK